MKCILVKIYTKMYLLSIVFCKLDFLALSCNIWYEKFCI